VLRVEYEAAYESSKKNMNYIELNVSVSPREPFTEILIAAFAEDGFESFIETDAGFKAYMQEHRYAPEMETRNWAWQLDGVELSASRKLLPRENWNKQWEESFEPILVDNAVYIHAPFHSPKPEVPYQLLIEPKMSFGTGHHQTTYLMIQFVLELDLAGQRVLDMGCGTGVLAILSSMRGSSDVVAIDIDAWAVENTRENADRNKVVLHAMQGTADVIPTVPFDIVLANINKNILLADMATYATGLHAGGTIIFSGFYTHDLPDIQSAAQAHGLQFVAKKQRDDWQAARFVKTGG
jgi:ribosomal protein L11 methyltransferase